MPNKIRFNQDYPVIKRSNELYERAKGLIPCFSQTLAKGPTQYVNGLAPKYLVKGKGSHVWDADGNEYIDYNMGIGPLSLGYAYPAVNEAIKKQLEDGITFSLMHPLEVEVAEMLREIIPNAESVRFSKSGADVTSAAIRIARAYTGKNKVLCCGYHGWHDWYVSTIGLNAGIPEVVKNLTYTFSFNDLNSLIYSIDDDVAAVILEPVVFEAPKDNFLHNVAELCKEKGIVLIFDEMWTGFRMALGGAQEYFGIEADLATFSKAIANGMPVSVLTGKKELMQVLENQVFFFTTFGGEALSLAAIIATIREMQEKDVIQSLSSTGRILKERYNELANELGMDYTRAIGYNFRTMITFDEKAGDPLILKSFVQQEMIKRGILWSGMHNMSFSHSIQDIEYTLSAYRESLSLLRQAVENNTVAEQIKGIPVQPTFRKTSGFNTKPWK
ncbi:MAG: aminotransferase class III-fold pyridoxal phosphate-dependent enzyme [Bacteroidales bacterium]|jgi:glutamate-1-semialdehyde aminotransferase